MEQEISVFECEHGKVRYRTRATAGDEFSFTFVRAEILAAGQGPASQEAVGRWALSRFAIDLTYKLNGEWITIPFAWKVVEALPREAFNTGWLVDASIAIYTAVWAKSDAEVDGLKKA